LEERRGEVPGRRRLCPRWDAVEPLHQDVLDAPAGAVADDPHVEVVDVEVAGPVGVRNLLRVDAVQGVSLHHLARQVEEDGAEAVAQVAVLPAPPVNLLKIALNRPHGVDLILQS